MSSGSYASLQEEETIQGFIADRAEEKVTIKKFTRTTLARKVKFFTEHDLKYDGKISLKLKKELGYGNKDWKDYWNTIGAPCVRVALREKRNSMVSNVQKAAIKRK